MGSKLDSDVSSGAVHLYRRCIGAGTPILMMHGGMGLDHSYLSPALDPLQDEFQLIYYDHRGCGRSAEPRDWNSFTIGNWVDDAHELRARLGLDRVVLFGHSYGGIIAQEYALRYPEHVAALILCAAIPVFDYVEDAIALAQARATQEQFAGLLAGISAPLADDDAFRKLADLILPLYFHQPSAGNLGALASVQMRAAAYNRSMVYMAQWSILDRLHLLATPTLILGGGDDWFAPVERTTARMHRLIPGSEMVVFERSGHYPFIEQRDEFVATVRRWLNTTLSSAAFENSRLRQMGADLEAGT